MSSRLFLHRVARVAAVALLALGVGTVDAPRGASRSAVRGEHAVAVTVEPHATHAAVEILRAGGNAVDAAIAATLTLTVTYPAAAPLGGGGFLLYRSPEGEYAALDFRETAPGALVREMFLDDEGRPVPERSTRGGLAVGVPGTVAGLVEAHRLWGSLPWSDLVRPAVRLAEDGFEISHWNAHTLMRREQDILGSPGARGMLARDGALLTEGDRLVQPDLARTLRRIAEAGRDGFYRGAVAEGIVATVRGHGGVMELDDLDGYRAVLREPVSATYRGHRVTAFPPPSSGGVVLLQILGMLERFDLAKSGFGSSVTAHRMVEAERRAYADRSRWLGDPDFHPNPVAGLLDDAYLASRARTIRDRRATPSRKISPGAPVADADDETTHLSVVDPAGGAVALTATLNQWLGATLVAEGTGILLNNEIDDFSLAPGVPNLYGLVGGDANVPAPGKRPLSSMTPTIVEAPGGARPILVLGSPGGATIITTVLQVLVNVVDHGLPLQEAVDAPRFHHQWLPDRIEHEPRAFPADVADALRARGHRLHDRGAIGNVSAVGVDGSGAWIGAADPRREGLAAGY